MPWTALASAFIGPVVNDLFGGGGSPAPAPAPAPSFGNVVGGAVGAASGAYQGSGDGGGAALADPFAPERKQYADKLSAMMNGTFGPGDSSYDWRKSQGIDAVNRGTAAKGMTDGGGRLLALENYGQGLASTEFQSQYARLAQLSGANTGSPATAGQIAVTANNRKQDQSAAFGNQVGKTVDAWGNSLSRSGFGGSNLDWSGGDTGGNTYGADSNNWVQQQSGLMPSNDPANIDPSLGWSI
jgi:hypothetical protein